ncbi:hypothetical protein [Nocardioides donggukensis]|uniref:Uncharacterized protein n=1 Tax=Nocardioides donggukensis TaxID=2774019 RepID=A0A927Q2K5_9ACTN|nr:hypothetical protein [Nocardioides donggukensis]MBD8870479.1 hypothetical protein [Nocardioides donggukensis]
MTTGDVVRAMVSRWYVTAGGLLATAAVVLLLQGAPGAYTTTVDVQFLAPRGPTAQPGNPRADLIALAGLVEREVGSGVQRETPVSPDVGLAGLGVTEGTMVFVPNSGGQWNYFFDDPVVRVQAVAPSDGRAAELRDAAVTRVRSTLEDLQVADGVPAASRVGTRLVPARPPVLLEQGSALRAMAVTALLGAALTCLAAVLFDRFMRHRAHLPASPPSAPATSA